MNDQYGISGSPGLVINGVKANSARDPASFLSTICGAFNEVPGACDEELSSESYSPGFGYTTSSGATTAAACGA